MSPCNAIVRQNFKGTCDVISVTMETERLGLVTFKYRLFVTRNEIYRSQALSPLPPLVVGRKTLVAASHVITCDTNVSTGAETTNNFCRSQLKRKNK